MGRDYDISTALTGDLGEAFLRALSPEQNRIMTAILDRQRQPLAEIVVVRRAISTELRRFLGGGQADRDKVVALGRRYGALDGELAAIYATAFTQVSQTLTTDQRQTLSKLRSGNKFVAAPAYLYAEALPQAPKVDDVAELFFPPR